MDDPSGSRAIHQFDASNVLHEHLVSSCESRHVTINILPDDVLIHIFHFVRLAHDDYMPRDIVRLHLSWRWHRLVHVSRRWRTIVFASPNFLELKLIFRPWERLKRTGLWPPLQIIINDKPSRTKNFNLDNIIAHRHRVCEINLFRLKISQYQRLVSAMPTQFPVLKNLGLGIHPSQSQAPDALPDGFLGGSAPSLQSLTLDFIPFPALPKLLLSATDLVHLTLVRIPLTWSIPPDTIVPCLAVLSNLKSLTMTFLDSFRWTVLNNRPGSRRPPPPTRTVLPALTRFELQGACGYLEDLVARIDAPLLDSIYITFFDELIFDIPRLAQLMRRTTRFQALNEAHVDFDYNCIQLGFCPPERRSGERTGMRISYGGWDRQLSYMAGIFTSFFPSVHMVEHVYIYQNPIMLPLFPYDVENVRWLGIFQPFVAAKNLYLTKRFARHITRALQVEGKTTEVFPTLQNIFLEGLTPSDFIQKGIGEFIAARKLSGHTITVSLWEGEQDWDY